VTPDALIFDVFGTLVDWRSSIALQVTAAFAGKGRAVDGEGFAGGFDAKNTRAKADTLPTGLIGLLDLFGAEAPFGPDHHNGGLAPLRLGQ
jgi:hypothetical protein